MVRVEQAYHQVREAAQAGVTRQLRTPLRRRDLGSVERREHVVVELALPAARI